MMSIARVPRAVVSLGVAALLFSMASSAPAVTIDWVTVGNPGNTADTTTYGAVAYDFRIGKYEVTIGQYTAFLNAADPNGTNPNGIYNSFMASNLNIAGILFTAGSSAGAKYSVMNNGGDSSNRPISYVSWFDAARFANWMHNGQGAGDTETGAYTLNGATSGTAPAKNPGAQFYIPTENEWYKAAFYAPSLNGGAGGYYTYATQSNTAPGNQIGTSLNQANSAAGGLYSVTQSNSYSASQNYLTEVGAFTNSASFYGTFDQSGNQFEWNALNGTASSILGWRGGGWNTGATILLGSGFGFTQPTSDEGDILTFRLAAPAAVPEPSTCAMALAGLACGGYLVRRRRHRA